MELSQICKCHFEKILVIKSSIIRASVTDTAVAPKSACAVGEGGGLFSVVVLRVKNQNVPGVVFEYLGVEMYLRNTY